MEAVIFKWKEPRDARKRISNSVDAQVRSSLLRNPVFILSSILLVLFALLSLLGVIGSVVTSSYGFGFYMTLALLFCWILSRQATTYSVTETGLRVVSFSSRKEYKWREIEWFEVSRWSVESPSRLHFKVNRGGKLEWVYFFFDHHEIDENRLMEILNQHLPGKKLDKPGTK